MTWAATAIIGSAVIGGGISAYNQKKTADAQQKEASRIEAVNNKKDAMYNLMSTIGGGSAQGMSPTAQINRDGGPGILGGMAMGGLGAVGTGLMAKQGAEAASDKAAYTKSLTEGQNLNNSWLTNLNNYRNSDPSAYLNRNQGSMMPWMMGGGMSGIPAAPSGSNIGKWN